MIKGKVWKLGDNIDTDAIIAARYLDTTDPGELASHCLEGVLEGFPDNADAGDILVAGYNFGSGSSREHAPVAIKAAGIACVVAGSFARIFYRNAFNVGLPLLESEGAYRDSQPGQHLEIDVTKGTLRNLSTGAAYQARPFPPFIKELLDAGGLVNYTKEKLKEKS